jgi:hypothetical protein
MAPLRQAPALPKNTGLEWKEFPGTNTLAGNPKLRGRYRTIDLLVPPSSDKRLLMLKNKLS